MEDSLKSARSGAAHFTQEDANAEHSDDASLAARQAA
jgi:hypothetical protein